MSTSTQRILVLHGPNLNLLGTREPEIYGFTSLAEINEALGAQARASDVAFEHFQSNHEGALIDRIHQAQRDSVSFMIINAGAYTHTSVALRDAVAAVNIPFIEVHLSNLYQRETFRHHSFLSELAQGLICGLGSQGYVYALDFAIKFLKKPH